MYLQVRGLRFHSVCAKSIDKRWCLICLNVGMLECWNGGLEGLGGLESLEGLEFGV